MALMRSAPEIGALAGDVSMGNLVSACLLAAFVILAIGFSIYHLRRVRAELNRLEGSTMPGRKEQEEQLANIGSKPAPSRQRRDPWES